MGVCSFCLFSVCVSVNFRVRSITLKPLDIFSWNFTQMLNTMRQRAEYMNRNSGFSYFWIYCPLCVNNFCVRSISLKPLDLFSWNFTQMLNTMRRRAEHMNRNSGFPTFASLWSHRQSRASKPFSRLNGFDALLTGCMVYIILKYSLVSMY